MSSRKKLFTCALLACCVGSFDTRAAQELVPIEKYIEQNQNNFQQNPGSLQFVFLRCASLLRLIAANFLHSSDAADKAKGESALEYTQKFLAASREVAKPFNEAFAVDQVNRMTDAYTERWQRAKALSGNFSDDPIIRSDLQVCSALSK